MYLKFCLPRLRFMLTGCFLVLTITLSAAFGQSNGKSIYQQIKSFQLIGGKADVANLNLRRDRVTMTFTGTFYFSAPVEGKITGAIFIGQGTFSAGSPPSDFEKANVRRLLKADAVESDFTTAVLRFSDDTMSIIGNGIQQGSTTPDAQKKASEIDTRMLKETGANLPARLTLSILNNEQPGVFFANFTGGKIKNFSYLFDSQTRTPTANFNLNAGEKGLIFTYKDSLLESEVLMAFYSLADYERRFVTYSDANDLVDITNYDMEIDLRAPKSKLSLRTHTKMTSLTDGVKAIPFSLGESLGVYDDTRLKKQMRMKAVRVGGNDIDFVQEDWEGGLTVFLPNALRKGEETEIEFTLEGDFMRQPEVASADDFSYPRSNSTWYPRHGYLDRSTFSLTYLHPKRLKIGSVGRRMSEEPWPEDKDVFITKCRVTQPIALATFALGSFIRHAQTLTWDGTDRSIPLEYNSVGNGVSIKEDFILAELSNSVRYFHKIFGDYPYETYAASYHPYGFGQGFASMLMIPPTDRANKYTYSFISHETAHQWWGNIVAWRSYRDQWLSEGFAEYSGVLYTQLRQNPKAAQNLIEEMRASLRRPPETLTGVGKDKLNDVGPIILGHRLSTSRTLDAYQTLIYNKGGLVLRMLHFLFTDPSSGEGQPFFDMMKDFVERYRNKAASTDDFRMVANEHFVKTPLARRYNIQNLNWFFQQWVYETHLPSYTLEYQFEDQPDGSVFFTGHVIQENAPENFFMPLPVSIKFGGNKEANGTVAALGPKTPFKIKLPMRPQKVELDPYNWVLSEKTSTK